jgi:deoxyadenosine/deoxycytidine kinase
MRIKRQKENQVMVNGNIGIGKSRIGSSCS